MTKKKYNRLPFLLKLGILTALTVSIWVGFDIYRAFTEKPNPIVPAELTDPLSPTLDTSVLESLRNKVYGE